MPKTHFSSQSARRALLLLISLAASVQAIAQPAPKREFGLSRFQNFDELPPGRFQKETKKLPPAARERARQWLRSMHFTEGDLPSMHTDADGGICFACHFALPPVPEPSATTEPESPEIAAAALPVSPFPASLIFHSKPGSPNVLYINFSGETVTNTQWNTELNRSSIPAVAFSSDSDLTTFSDSEQTIIKRVWQRMAEDFAPFDINVTTERPATFTTRTAVALITRKTDANGSLNPFSTAGGVAYVNVFDRPDFANYRPAWVYHDNLSNNESFIAEAASHEIGHNLGLTHDGTTTLDYYGGHGSGDTSWGPIMGTGYNRNVSQWSKGEYFNANNTQDDLATIAGKINYRQDDHGNTPGTATPLVITNTTQIVSTTFEDDPSNNNPANKGILERNNDIDVFSFVTGSGAVQLTVIPWFITNATRGGNLDVLLELYNEAGTLVTSSNPASLTSATISTNLAEGIYYLHVKNTGTGNPTSSSPTGYTSYGSIGWYHISGSIQDASGFIIPPVAEAQTTTLSETDRSTHTFTVTYSDNVSIAVASIDSNDVLVTGPNGYSQLAQLVSVSSSTNGSPRTATYSVAPPGGGSWSAAHNGTYTLLMQPGQVADTEGAFVPASTLGQFDIIIPVPIYSANMDSDPGWTLQPDWQYGTPAYPSGSGPTAGFTGTKIIGYNLSGNYPNRLEVKYATTPAINCSGTTSLTLRFKRWLRTKSQDAVSIQVSTNNSTWTTVWSTTSAISDATWQTVQYPLPSAVAGSPTLRIRWSILSNNSQNEIGWNIDDVEILGDGSLDSSPPAATLSVADLTQGGSPSHSCSVTYSDETAVRLSSLDGADLWVTGPNNFAAAAGFTGADLPADGSPITASYDIPAPGGGLWDAIHNGTYTITLQEDAVEDTLNNNTPLTILGTFQVNISSASPGVLTVTPASDLIASGTSGGPFTPGSVIYTLGNSGESSLTWTAGKTADWLDLGATEGTLAPGASTEVIVSINALANSLAAGTYADAVSFLNTASGNGNTSRNVSLTINSPGILTVTSSENLSSSGPQGGPFTPNSITYTLGNSGGSPLNWSASTQNAWVGLSAPGGILAPGTSTQVTVSLNPSASTLPAGTYTDTVSFINTSTGNGNTGRSVNLTINSPGFLDVFSEEDLVSSGPQGGPFSPDSVTYTLTNLGGSPLDWTANNSEEWVSLSQSSGTLEPGASEEIIVSINPAASTLEPGDYLDTVIFSNTTNGGGNSSWDVTLTITSPGSLVVAPAGPLAASGLQGGPFSPDSVIYTLTNPGDEPINWTITKTAAWISLSEELGSLPPGASTQVTASINAEAATLEAGAFSDTLTFTNTTNGSGNTTREVTLSITSPGSLAVTPAGPLAASGLQGGPFSPDSVIFTLTNPGDEPINWTITKTAAWISLSEELGSLLPGASTQVTASINAEAASLEAGAFSDTLTFTNTTNGSGNTTREVTLSITSPGSLAVTPAGPLAASGFQGGPFSPDSVIYTLTNPGDEPINWTITKTGAWISLSEELGSLPPGASTQITASINAGATTLEAGAFSDTLTFTNTTNGSGNTTREVTLTVNSPIRFASLGRAESGAFQLLIQGPPGSEVVVEACENFANWTPIATLSIGNDGTATLTDPESIDLPTRFYRMRSNP